MGVTFNQTVPHPKYLRAHSHSTDSLGPDLMFMYDFMTLFAENVTEVDYEAERDDIVKFYTTFTPPPANKLQVLRALAHFQALFIVPCVFVLFGTLS